MQCLWHRRDLRLADNRGVAAATDAGETCGIFVFDPGILAHAGRPRIGYLLDALEALRSAYRERGSDLLLAAGDPRERVPEIASELSADRVVWCRDYTGLSSARDRAVDLELDERGIGGRSVHDAVRFPPGSITTTDGEPYQVFTYYGRKWHEREAEPPADTPTAGDLLDASAVAETVDRLAELTEKTTAARDATEGSSTTEHSAERSSTNEDSTAESSTTERSMDESPETTTRPHTKALDPWPRTVPSVADLGVDPPEADVPDAGTGPARERLETFCAGPIYRYATDRDYPARGGTSRLSADLSFGTIGIREVYDATDAAAADATGDDERESVRTFQDQLAWREFYTQVLWNRPETVTENYQSFSRPIEWRDDPEGLAAWKAGETGYPIVDAGMHQLRAEAYMHNRLRMIVASFLTKDLLIDWRAGYDWFRRRLVDHDTANDVGGWQWAASTGTDAQPFFRVFNPMTQGERYDPDATYIRRYVPALRDVPSDLIHRWDELDEAERSREAPDYPAPIVDHASRRERAIATFERARGGG